MRDTRRRKSTDFYSRVFLSLWIGVWIAIVITMAVASTLDHR